jgi:hypothetical protein
MNRSLAFALAFSSAVSLQSVHARAQEAQAATDPGVFVSEGTLDTYVGTYRISPGFDVRVWREGDHLMVQASGQDAWPLLAQSESVFHVTGLATKVTFGFNASGDIDHLVMLMDGRETKAIRR